MDMLRQAEDALSSLGVSGWDSGSRPLVEQRFTVEQKTKPADAFLVAPADDNKLPTFYDNTEWQGMVFHS